MSPAESVRHIVHEAAALLGLPAAADDGGRAAWRIDYDAATTIEVELEPLLNRAVLSCRIAEVPLDARHDIHEVLLEYNAAWRVTGGLRMALTDERTWASLLLDVPAAELHTSLLADLLSNIASICGAWRFILANSKPHGADGAVPALRDPAIALLLSA
jgi:hypothetical protein